MPIYALGDLIPTIDSSAFIHPEAVIIGSVHIGSESSIWPGAVLRADDNEIRIGDRTSIQDGSVLHCTHDLATVVGNECVVGHIAHLEGCIVQDRCLIGNGSVVLHRAVIESGSLVGSNAVVLADAIVPSFAMALGVPAKIRENACDPNLIDLAVMSYVNRVQRYKNELKRLD